MAYSLGIPDLGGQSYLTTAVNATQIAQRDRELAQRAEEARQQAIRDSITASYRNEALRQQAGEAAASGRRADAQLNLQAGEAADRASARASEDASLGKAQDLGAGYRGVITGPHSLQVIAPEDKPFTPDPATLASLQKAHKMYVPLGPHGGTVTGDGTETTAAGWKVMDAKKLGLGAGFENLAIMTDAKGKTHVLHGAPEKPLDFMTSSQLGTIDDSIADLTKKIVGLQALPPDQKIDPMYDKEGKRVVDYNPKPMFGGTPAADFLKKEQANLMVQQMRRASLLDRAGKTRSDTPAASAPPAVQTPAPSLAPTNANQIVPADGTVLPGPERQSLIDPGAAAPMPAAAAAAATAPVPPPTAPAARPVFVDRAGNRAYKNPDGSFEPIP